MDSRSLRRRRALAAAALVTLAAGTGGGLVWLIHVLFTKGLQAASNWAQLGSLVLAVTLVPVGTVILEWWRRADPSAASSPTANQVDHAHRTLAGLVLAQWREEILARRLDSPTPLAVRWRLTQLPVMDLHDHVLRPNPLRTLRGHGRRRFTGRTDRISELAEEFRRLPRRRLVILGDPGMGKTTLAVLLLRELLRRYEPDQPVPVLLSVSDWRPADEPLRDWLARRLTQTYPALRAADFGPDAATTLITQRRILPVLDGLDELPEEVRPDALVALNAATADDPLILTCRTAEYEAAITRLGGAVLTGGAVIEPDPLRPGDAAAYLRSCLRERSDGDWRDLMSALADRNAPITRALTTPLELWLLRKVYIDTGTDPGELLDTHRFPTATEITDHLLDHLVHAAITARSPHGNGDPYRPSRSWDPDAAKRWLAFLADHLHAIGGRDIAWWRLHHTTRIRLVHRLLVGLVLGSAFGSVGALAGALGRLSTNPMAGLTGGLVGGFAIGAGIGLMAELATQPAHASLRLRGRGRALARSLTVKLAGGAAIGLISVAVGELGAIPLTTALAVGLAGGLIVGLITGLLGWAASPLPDDLAQTPAGTLRRDLQLSIGRTITTVLLGGFVFGLMVGLVKGSMVLPLALSLDGAGVVLAVVLLLFVPARYIGTATASSVYLGTVTLLSTQRHVPRELMRFLDDAHRTGLLRQVGPVYQFRHAKLQDRLAHTYRQSM
ncbi:NACHT domain-containing protein [Actinoallomurus sp. CA-150999]|uniref:NACHT domain-containing protein n=1 Tax=Actinoallomurus sp. CA-150999 TaxID=3239887 RepID=UPI003D8BB246